MSYIESEDTRASGNYWRIEYIPAMDAFRVDTGITYRYIPRAALLEREQS